MDQNPNPSLPDIPGFSPTMRVVLQQRVYQQPVRDVNELKRRLTLLVKHQQSAEGPR